MSTETPEQIEQAAGDDVRRADETLADLERRVLNDDQDVTPAEIETARSARYFAGLRQQAATRKAAKLREQALAAQREEAMQEARAILAAHDDASVDAAARAAGEAMMKLRDAVRARNDARARALLRLQASPVEPIYTQPGDPYYRAAPSGVGYGQTTDSRDILWVDGQSLPHLNEDTILDRARKHPAQVDYEAARAEQEAGAARLLASDTALHREDQAAFEQLPAARRKRVLDALGEDWDEYMRRREASPLPAGRA
ncbi:hypothetical protein ACFUIZ_06695 [Streptomyces cinereoruber]|uniref:hypothetical protein n=1 Tax=Streptomyces cinereoruber TaxID=67260 RepID=UPI00363EA018